MEPTKFVGYHTDDRNSSRSHQSSKEIREKINPASRTFTLGDKLKIERPSTRSYDVLQHDIKHDLGEKSFASKSSRSHRKQSSDKKSIKDDELVKHMSKLPGYLQHEENEENLQKKVLNCGVLDWKRVEKWNYNEKQVPHRSRKYSPSTSSTSSPFSTVGSSTLSTGSDSGPLAQSKKGSSSLSSHLTSSSNEIYSRGGRLCKRNVIPAQDFKARTKKVSVGGHKLHRTDVTNSSMINLQMGNGKGSGSRTVTEIRALPNSEDSEFLFCTEGKMKDSVDTNTHKAKKFQEFTFPDQSSPGRNKTIVLLLPRNLSRKSCSGASPLSESATLDEGKSTTEVHRRRSSDNFLSDEAQFVEINPVIPHSSPLSSGIESSNHEDVKYLTEHLDMHQQSESTRLSIGRLPEVKNRRLSDSHYSGEALYGIIKSDNPHPSPLSRSIESCRNTKTSFVGTKGAQDLKAHSGSAEMPSVHSVNKLAEETKLAANSTKIVVVEPTNGPGLKTRESAALKSRYQSPNGQSTVRLGKMSRSFSFKEASVLPPLSSNYVTVKSGPVGSDYSVESSNKEKTNVNGKARSSPLRRLLDPLLRPRSANRVSFQDEPSPTQSTSETSHQRSDSLNSQPVKRNLDFSNCKPTSSDGLHQDDKHQTSMVQALLQVTVRNGLPWFTFAVDKNKDVLAATMKKISVCGKYDCSWIYTFYSFHQVTKKSGGWISQGSKVKNREYVPNVVGEMKVSGAQCPNSTRHKTKDQCMVREFVLSAVESRSSEDTLDFLQKNELAAIVVKVPKESIGSSVSDGWQKDKHTELSKMTLSECMQDVKCCSETANTVVLLPSGFHGKPASGLPSPLIDRWKSGGACDCGGWDVGCKLRVLSNQEQLSEASYSSKACDGSDQFDLFIQEGDKGDVPLFSLTTYKKGIYSIDFSAFISSLQAFSICIAFLHSRNLAELSEVGYLFEETTNAVFR
ncbi:hypothetical protein MKX01_002004 [Papaver californicum]|nr:hypothetical protein MKX01_002004 [Papaver californicum]